MRFAASETQRRLRTGIARAVALLACALIAACQASDGKGSEPGAAAGTGGAPVLPPIMDSAGAGAVAVAADTTAAAGSVALAGTGGVGGITGAAGSDPLAGGSAGAAGMHDHPASQDHCVDGYPADPRDAMLTGEPDQWMATNGDIDLALPAAVLTWMDERVWKQSHDAWHNVRRCTSFFPGFGGGNLCTEHAELVAEHQECADAEDGYQFLVMHRHMMQGLKQAFPQHAVLFEGFPSFPFDAQGVPEAWRGRFGTGWSAQIQETARALEEIESHLDEYPTEGALGQFIQCGIGGNGMSSIHGAMHFKWVVNGSPNSLGVQAVNIGNFMFWKLHGWIDQIWERYRIAKGLTPDEPALATALTAQCREMHALGLVFDASLPDDTGPSVPEYGFFHENVRPILEAQCASCHGGATPMAGLALAGTLSSAEIVAELVGVSAKGGGQFKRVVAGDPMQSWLYLKVTDTAKNAGCTGSCNTQGMPPTGRVELSASQLELIRQWIANGAAAPTTTP